MSRLDEIKARAEAATKGPWSFDWSEGEVPVFYGQTTKISGTFSVEANTIEDAEFIEAAREDVPWLVERVRELSGAICWDTTCLNCSSLLDSNYDQYMRAEIAEAEVERLTDLCGEFRKREERLNAEVERLRGWIDRSERQEARARRAEAEVARLTAEREWFKDRFPCDGVCVDAPEEACSRHGRNPADLWRIIGEVAAERNALAAQVARVEEVLEHWRTVDEGNAAYAERIGERSRFADGLASRADMLRAALTGSETDTSDTQSTDQEVKS